MDEKKMWNGVLAEGEEIRWQGSPKNVGLMDTASKGKTILLWAVALAWLAASFALVLPRVIATDDSALHMVIVMILIDCIPVLMLSMPSPGMAEPGGGLFRWSCQLLTQRLYLNGAVDHREVLV